MATQLSHNYAIRLTKLGFTLLDLLLYNAPSIMETGNIFSLYGVGTISPKAARNACNM